MVPGNGSRFLKEPFDWTRDHRFEATEKIMEVQFLAVERRLERIEAMIIGVEKRMWMTVFGVVGVILSQAVQSILQFSPK
ncbi:MAG: hypothetical protein U1E48_09680 [Paracoccaceae bacterium]